MYGASYNVVKTMYMLLHSAAGVKYKLQDETTVYCNANEYMKDHIFELGRNIQYYDWSSQLYTHNLSSCEIEAWKKFRPKRS